MKITKTTTKDYEIKPLLLKWHTTVGKFIKIRGRLGLDVESYKKCFICDKPFKDEDVPAFISVTGVGNMFACDKCMKTAIEKEKKNE